MTFELWVLSSVLAATGIGWLLRSRRGPIRIDETGVRVLRSPASPLHLCWEEIDGFGVAYVGEIEGGLYQAAGRRYVGVRLTDSSPKKAMRSCGDNRKLSGYDILLTPDRGMTVEQFAAHLESHRARFKKLGMSEQEGSR
jgi:hypothetical protein